MLTHLCGCKNRVVILKLIFAVTVFVVTSSEHRKHRSLIIVDLMWGDTENVIIKTYSVFILCSSILGDTCSKCEDEKRTRHFELGSRMAVILNYIYNIKKNITWGYQFFFLIDIMYLH